ncbi:Nif11-like leader peptide family RiPP precursor [Synechococcus sp. CCY9202]|uniref:Nif11-like leader peptide family RiPP precursor n=1 Tax=Synechococcus sp. CCY9202 TaxID=174698 RepID=UPI002B1F849B|nr:Nif11-like leader peptide family RiPP precursor [Synechococcus sp. CCY9202]MEA5423426.1 Nif11-like leader peptide family RiPP precursor [Synechococcus sp. CCY9202]
MSLDQLDAFLARARADADLQQRLNQPLELAAFLALAAEQGYQLSESDVIAAQQRQESELSDEELQHRTASEAYRLRHFIPS